MVDQPTGPRVRSRGNSVMLGLLASILVNGVLPVIAYGQLTDRGWTPTTALALTSIFPLAATGVSLGRSRSMDGLSMISLTLIVLGVAGSLVSGNPRFALLRESVLTGVFGLAWGVSLLLPRPLAFYFGRQFATGGDAVLVERWNSYWVYPQFRRVQYTITIVWTTVLLLDALVRVVLTLLLPVNTMVWLSQVILYIAVGGTMAWMFWYVQHTRRSAVAAGADPM